MDIPDHIAAHKHCANNRHEIIASEKCGCFHCIAVFESSEVKLWFDEMAFCPRCGIDSVIGSASGYPLTREFLSQMNAHWFG